MATVLNNYMKELMNCIKDKRNIAESTATQYIQTLYKLNGNKPFTNLTWLRKYDNVQAIIDTYAPSTKINQYAVITSALSCFQDKPSYRSAYTYWRNKMLLTVEERRKEPLHVKSEAQEANMISWEEVEKKKSELREAISSLPSTKLTVEQFNNMMDYVLLSLYTDMPPRRNADYLHLYVVKKLEANAPTDKNYYDMSNNEFTFNRYKTAKKDGQVKLVAPQSLVETLTKLFAVHPLMKGKWKEAKLLVKADGSALDKVNDITRRLNRIFGKKIGSSMLRHIYLSSKYGSVVKDMESDSKAMSHSVATQRAYVKLD